MPIKRKKQNSKYKKIITILVLAVLLVLMIISFPPKQFTNEIILYPTSQGTVVRG